MKKISTIFLLGLLVVSCEKDWTCECYDPYGQEESWSYIIKGKSKRQAKNQCTGSVNVGLISIDGDESCTLKK